MILRPLLFLREVINMVIVTHHAEERTKRLGLSKKKAIEIAEDAFENGVKLGETTGRLRKYFDSLYFHEKTANNIRIHHQKVFLFNDNILITILDLPQNLNNSVEAIKRKRMLGEFNKNNKRLLK